jgi:hypothetical protein
MGTVPLPTATDYDPGVNADGSIVYTDLFNIISEFNDSIESSNLANDSVTTDKIANSAVTADKISATSIKEVNMDYTESGSGCKVWQCGPNYVDAGGGRIVRVQKTIAFTAVATEEGPFTFNLNDATTDCIDGNPSFSTASGPPYVTMLGAPIVTSSDNEDQNNCITGARITAIDEGSITMYITHDLGTPAAANVQVEFGVAGGVA